ncbi:hypothetical protein D3C73_861140 [compost metagenome]
MTFVFLFTMTQAIERTRCQNVTVLRTLVDVPTEYEVLGDPHVALRDVGWHWNVGRKLVVERTVQNGEVYLFQAFLVHFLTNVEPHVIGIVFPFVRDVQNINAELLNVLNRQDFNVLDVRTNLSDFVLSNEVR